MATIAIRPTTFGVPKDKRYTIHTTNINIFTVQEKCTAVLSFQRRKDAVHFCEILEAKFAVDKQWPMIEFSQPNEWFIRGDTPTNINISDTFVTEWDTDSLHNVCINNNLPLVEVQKILLRNDKLNMKGHCISWDIEPKHYIEYFNHLIDEQSF
jgi:hypothetical protein